MSGTDDIDSVIEHGIVFQGKGESRGGGRVKTKARKKRYITGSHNTPSSRQKNKRRRDRDRRLNGR